MITDLSYFFPDLSRPARLGALLILCQGGDAPTYTRAIHNTHLRLRRMLGMTVTMF